MTVLQNSGTFHGLNQTISGDGALSIGSEIATITSGELSGAAQFDKRYLVKPSEVFTMKVFARLKSGVGGRIALSYPTASSAKDGLKITSPSWQWYEVRYLVPITHDIKNDFINIQIGMYNEDGGELEISELVIESENNQLPQARTTCFGRIQSLLGVVSIEDDYVHQGIVSIDYDSGSNPSLITIQTDYTYNTNNFYIPLAFVQHYGGQNRNVVISAEMDRFGLGRVYVNFSDPTTGTGVDISALGEIKFQFMTVL